MAFIFKNLSVKLLPADDEGNGDECAPCTHGDSACLPCTALCTGCTAGCTDETGCGCTDTICGPCTCTNDTMEPIVSEIPSGGSTSFRDELSAHKTRLQEALAKAEETEYRLNLGGKPGTLEELDEHREALEAAEGKAPDE